MFNAGCDDSLVKSRSGHCSNAVDTYKRPLEELQDSISRALQPPKPENVQTNECENENTFQGEKVLTMTVPDSITKIVIMKNWKTIFIETLEEIVFINRQ